MFPEIQKAIQHRRAQYYMLIHEFKYIEHQMQKGAIEEKEYNELRNSIDAKVYYLQMHQPEIKLDD